MSEYKRFVSYIYVYDKGVKSRNVGFAKVEARNGQCRITINLKDAYKGNGKEQQVYLFYRNGEQLLGTYMGSFVIRNGIGEFKDSTDSSNIKNSGHSLNQMGGIFIRSPEQEGQVYASGWDDYPLLVEKFIMEDKGNTQKVPEAKAEEVRREEIKPQEIKSEEIKLEGIKLESQMKSEPEIYINKVQPGSVIQFSERNAKQSSLEQKLESKPMSILEAVELKEEEKVMIQDLELQEENKKNEEYQNQRTNPQVTLQTNFIPNQPIQRPQEPNIERQIRVQRENITEEETKRLQAQEENIRKEDMKKEASQNIREPILESQEERGERLWEKLMNQFPKVIAFEDETDIICLKIDLKDLENLPKENWILGNNSFLLHGYYNFRYLLLARLRENEYILGVPGMYHNKERFMAAMFGFETFKTVISCKQKTGQFGYWYQKVKL